MQQPEEFCRYIMNRYHMVATLASHMAISSTGKGCSQKDGSQKPKDRQRKQGAVVSLPRRLLSTLATDAVPASREHVQGGPPAGEV
jgi:hypothetical protein